ncbi:MAG TPA: ATP-binding protein [Candidatus Nitrosotenuis sp.]|nr:ATP-binding protein [Candidatus Nitrosotenuis sp.]
MQRRIKDHIASVLQDTPIILISGPRQCGKSTLASEFSDHHATLDDYSVLDSIRSDPEGYLKARLMERKMSPFILDEAQLAPELFRPLKKLIDLDKKPGMMILTGSANILSWEKMPDSLVGRMESIELFPFSLSEVSEVQSNWIDGIFDGGEISELFQTKVAKEDYEYFLMSSGFPEAFARRDPHRREDWLRNYVHALIERDARTLGNIESPGHLHKLMIFLSNQIGSTVNQTNIAQQVGISRPTMSKYLSYLELLYLITFVHPWHRNLNKRLVKTPKIYLNDTGILRYFRPDSAQTGTLVEQHVLCELKKQISFSRSKPRLYFYRTLEGAEVDFILEHRNGQLIGIEVKSTQQISQSTFKNLISFKKDNEHQFLKGLVFYNGDSILPFGPNLFAIPLRCLV